MVELLRFIRCEDSFDPETLKTLGAAYDLAIANVGDAQPTIREVVATRIIATAMKGERDIHRLCRAALHGIALAG
jgi:hypothetical protein